MTFNEYQKGAAMTAIYPNRRSNFIYPVLGLVGEAGEIANKIKKVQRDHGGKMTSEFRADIYKEIGDCLWYIAALCGELDFSMDEVAITNLNKLKSRQQRGTLTGSGDNR